MVNCLELDKIFQVQINDKDIMMNQIINKLHRMNTNSNQGHILSTIDLIKLIDSISTLTKYFRKEFYRFAKIIKRKTSIFPIASPQIKPKQYELLLSSELHNLFYTLLIRFDALILMVYFAKSINWFKKNDNFHDVISKYIRALNIFIGNLCNLKIDLTQDIELLDYIQKQQLALAIRHSSTPHYKNEVIEKFVKIIHSEI